MIEPTLGESFRPDIVYLNQRNEKVAVIEYESTNSSDERLMAKDFTHFETAIAEYRDWKIHPHEASWVLPELWLIISTLPKRPVHHWPWHGYNSLTRYPPFEKDPKRRNANPYAYYAKPISEWSRKTWENIEKSVEEVASLTRMVWANIDGLTISVETINGVRVNDGYSVPLRR